MKINKKNIELDRQSYAKIEYEQSVLLDKSIISISGAAFTIMIPLMEHLFKIENSYIKFFFWVSLILLSLSIITTILSFHYSESSARFCRERGDNCEQNEDASILEQSDPYHAKVKIFCCLRLWCFICGIGLLGTSIFIGGIFQI